MDRSSRLWIALAVGLSHWALLMAIQAGSFCAYLMPAGSDPQDALRYLSTIPFIQGQNLAVAAVLAALAYVLAATRITRWIVPLLQGAAAAIVLIDQVFYKISFDHLRPSLFEVGRTWKIGVAVSSLARETDWVFYLAVALAAIGETAGG